MATHENFSLEIASSDDEYESSPQFRSGALPKLAIPSPFQSEESSPDVESDSGAETPSTPGTPVAPLSPLGTEFSFLDVSSQTSEAGEFATPRPRKKRFTKRRVLNLKRAPGFDRRGEDSPSVSSKRTKLTRPKSELFANVHFPRADESYHVKFSDCDTFSNKQLLVPHGNQIFNLEILSNVFTLLNCPYKNCLGKPRLHQHITRDGLLRFFLLVL